MRKDKEPCDMFTVLPNLYALLATLGQGSVCTVTPFIEVLRYQFVLLGSAGRDAG